MITPTGIFAILAVVAGVSNALPPQKIVGGERAALGEFPYQISLRYRGRNTCGGTIISKRHIITAGHCVYGKRPNDFRVATGSISYNGGELHSVSKVECHPKYGRDIDGSPINDIAIIHLTADISFNENQDKLDLPTKPTSEGVTAYATGWGRVAAKSRSPTLTLLKVELKTISNAECRRLLDNIHENQICTFSGRGLGTCNGDSGGPLAYDGQLIGVVSYGTPCAVGDPDVFTSIYHHLSWIQRAMKD